VWMKQQRLLFPISSTTKKGLVEGEGKPLRFCNAAVRQRIQSHMFDRRTSEKTVEQSWGPLGVGCGESILSDAEAGLAASQDR
jgi:hypothetical protein